MLAMRNGSVLNGQLCHRRMCNIYGIQLPYQVYLCVYPTGCFAHPIAVLSLSMRVRPLGVLHNQLPY